MFVNKKRTAENNSPFLIWPILSDRYPIHFYLTLIVRMWGWWLLWALSYKGGNKGLAWLNRASLVAQMVKRLPAMWETWVQSLGREDLLEKEMAIHSSTLAWKIPWTEEPDRLQSMGSQRVRHDWATSLSLSCLTLELPWWLSNENCSENLFNKLNLQIIY